MSEVVAIGGGHGLAVTLRAATSYATNLTAVVSVADDGGSSGRLRGPGLPAMGDLRRCISAVGDPANPWTAVLEHRIKGGDLDGHAVGNLMIAALTDASGDFSGALREVSRLVDATATVLPSTDEVIDLCASTAGGERRGQVAVLSSSSIDRVWLAPPAPVAHGDAVAAIEAADQIVLGPGSLFTSVLAAVAVPGIRDAVAASSARSVYVCNLRPQEPETSGYDVGTHLAALARHGVDVDVVLCHPGALPLGVVDVKVVEVPVASASGLTHDPALLGAALASLM
jgi:uncharacterized cofD-like protein